MEPPLFATVTFVSDQDGSLGCTLRVPIGPESSIRRLAKDAMQRLLASRRASGSAKDFPPIAVSQVRVGGLEPHHAEIFSGDLVTHVVRVMEEVVFMRLRFVSPSVHATAAAPSADHRAAAPSVEPSAATTRATSPAVQAPPVQLVPVAAPPIEAAPPAVQVAAPAALPPPVRLAEKAVSTAAAAAPVRTAPSQLPKAKVAAKRSREELAPKAKPAMPKVEVDVEVALEAPRRAGWGPEASKFFAANYCSSPDRVARQLRDEANRNKKEQEQPEKKNPQKDKEVQRKKDLGEKKVQRKELKKEEEAAKHRPGWGPDAHKSFAPNYVSDPNALVREIRLRKREEERLHKAGGAPAAEAAPEPVPAPTSARPMRIARQLEFEEEEGRRSTVGHQVDSAPVDVDKESSETEEPAPKSAAKLPKGWGTEAMKYFDPATYCDDPSKAKASVVGGMPRPVRQNRTPPSVL